VYAIDSNEEMLNQSCECIGDNELFHPILATAESTTLDDDSLDLIVVGQAFHRFNYELFKKECKRILKDNIVAILYNN
jgi:ubiquinone/menaquinone biosynthesis C-methylase UbiE